jgi:hypothetical protein
MLAGATPATPFSPAVELPHIPQIKGACMFGYAEGGVMAEKYGMPGPASHNQTMFVVNGELDHTVLLTADTDHVNKNDAYLILKNVDHFSIADEVFLVREGDIYSTRPREEQLDIVKATVLAALKAMMCPTPKVTARPCVPDYVKESFGDGKLLRAWLQWLTSAGE